MTITPGKIVEFQGKELPVQLGVVLSVTSKGIRILQLNRKETTVTERNILHQTSQSKASCADLDSCWEIAKANDDKRDRLASTIDLSELHQMLCEDPRPYSLNEMAGFIAQSDDEDTQAALLRRLVADSFYFRQRKEGYLPVALAEVKASLECEKKRIEQEAEDKALLVDLKTAFNTRGETITCRVAEVLDSLVQVLLLEAEAPVPKRVHDILEKAGFHAPRQLFGFLIRIGRLKPDEHLDLLKYKVPVDFPDDCVSAAEQLVLKPAPTDGRTDLQSLSTWAIDSETTRDRDDAFSIESDESGFKLWIHISDVAAFVLPGTSLDREACRRGTTIYLPDGNIPMLPPKISEEALSLGDDRVRPALTWGIRLSTEGVVTDEKCFPSFIRVSHATDYLAADNMLDRQPELSAGVSLSKLLRDRRRKAGALLIERQREIKFVITPDGVQLGYRPSASPTSDMIAEFMILANHLAARRCQDNGIPCIYRTQERSEQLPQLPTEFEAVSFFQALRYFKRTALGSVPGFHSSLGIGPYCQVTSPLRRYSDLLVQRQLKGHLAGHSPPYDAEGFSQALMMSDEATRTAEMIMKSREEFFLLKFVQQEIAAGQDTSAGTVVDLSSNDVVVYIDALCAFRHCRRPAVDPALGQRIVVRFKRADPFEGTLKFEIQPERREFGS
ncbi:hypothetical protein AUK22_00805 [bacterium CG2_30_54_10]|nr:MAG: hypothetical protein AUK22_00805 [bacterium CG2_30_54_10]